MRVYLVRHGEALPPQESPERELSREGVVEVAKVAEFLKFKIPGVTQVWHSPKERAKQTAEALHEMAFPKALLKKKDGLLPNDPVGPILTELEATQEDTVLVGHLPFVGSLASAMLMGDESQELIVFHTATVVALECFEGSWYLLWAVSPLLFEE